MGTSRVYRARRGGKTVMASSRNGWVTDAVTLLRRTRTGPHPEPSRPAVTRPALSRDNGPALNPSKIGGALQA